MSRRGIGNLGPRQLRNVIRGLRDFDNIGNNDNDDQQIRNVPVNIREDNVGQRQPAEQQNNPMPMNDFLNNLPIIEGDNIDEGLNGWPPEEPIDDVAGGFAHHNDEFLRNVQNMYDNGDDNNEYEFNFEYDDDSDDDIDENDIENADDKDDNRRGNQPLNENSQITVGQSMLLLLQILFRHNLTLVCLQDIIRVIELHCPSTNFKKNSLFKFLRYFKLDKPKFKKHYYCSKCVRELDQEHAVCPTCENAKNQYFIQLPFTDHRKEMFKRRSFYRQLQHRFHRPQGGNSVTDIYDGELYKTWFINNGFLSQVDNISFTWYVDAFPVFSSSKVSATAMYLTINELPSEEREKQENTLLAGVWYGDIKAQCNMFFYKFREEFEKILRGFVVRLPTQELKTIGGILLAGTCDLVARYDVLNFVQFNGRFGCFSCLAEGTSVRTGLRSSVHVYPYIAGGSELRTTASSVRFANEARPNHPVFGVKGHSALSRLMPDFIKGMGIDRMHGVDGGVIKKLLSLWFDSQYNNYPFSLHRHVVEVNRRLLQIKPPKFIHRMPRSVDDLVHWKASELKTFYFYYAISILEGIMPEIYLNHSILLIVASKILSSENISQLTIEVADDLLQKFVREFEVLYGLRFCSINIHQLVHLANCVKRLGPLWVYNCYEYKDVNGQIVKSIHGTWHLDTQISKNQIQFIKMPRLLDALPEGAIKDFCSSRKKQVKIIEQIENHIYTVGTYKQLADLNQNTHATVTAFLRNSNLIGADFEILIYYRLLKDKKLFIARMYSRNLQTDSSAVFIRNELNQISSGIIQYFLKINDEHFAAINVLRLLHTYTAIGNLYQYSSDGYYYKCRSSDNYIKVPVSQLITTCFYININNSEYASIPINQIELE